MEWPMAAVSLIALARMAAAWAAATAASWAGVGPVQPLSPLPPPLPFPPLLVTGSVVVVRAVVPVVSSLEAHDEALSPLCSASAEVHRSCRRCGA